MCRDGKTYIDAFKHQLWRVIHAVLLDAIEQGTFFTPAWATLTALPTLPAEGQSRIVAAQHTPEIQDFANSLANNSTTFTHYLRAARTLERILTLKNLRVYTLGFLNESDARSAWDRAVNALKPFTSITYLQAHAQRFNTLVLNDPQRYLVQESAQKEHHHPAENMSRNWSKMNTLYRMDSQGEVVDTGFRGPFHNTLAKTSSDGAGDRTVRFLTEMRRNQGPIEVSAYIKGQRTPGMHTDHIVPLALGGRHATDNLAFISAEDNMCKKDTLTYEAYALVVSSPQGPGIINGDAFLILRQVFEEIGLDRALFFAKRPHIEHELRDTMDARIASFAAASEVEKRAFLKKWRPDLNHSRQTLFMERFARKTQT